jgi:hypothetical protein
MRATSGERMHDYVMEVLKAYITTPYVSALAIGLPRGVASADPVWVRFIGGTRPGPRRRGTGDDVASSLLLITIEGILHQHVTSQQRYRELLGRDLGDAKLRGIVKRHLASVIAAIVHSVPDGA